MYSCILMIVCYYYKYLNKMYFFFVIFFKGDGVKVVIFDIGLLKNYFYFRKVMDRINWIEEKILDDGN